MLDKLFTAVANRVAHEAGQPATFAVMLLLIIVWGLSGPLFGFSDTWQLIVNTSTTIITFLMVFIIQNSQNRDGAALQAKLDELIRAVEGARNQFIGIEHLTDKQLEELRSALERECGTESQGGNNPLQSVDRLLSRS